MGLQTDARHLDQSPHFECGLSVPLCTKESHAPSLLQTVIRGLEIITFAIYWKYRVKYQKIHSMTNFGWHSTLLMFSKVFYFAADEEGEIRNTTRQRNDLVLYR
jgi:hypothetical protein